MLSYRHSFHAGNHADVLKHLILMMVLNSIRKKDKPAIYIDTHSGAGLYALDSAEALQNSEFVSGIEKLKPYSGEQEAINAYRELLVSFENRNQYPGSPLIAANMLRKQDKLALMEFHNNEVNNLKKAMAHAGAVSEVGVHHRDGFEGLVALLPPKPSRGLVLIDPPYERIEEYDFVLQTMQKSLKKWPTGIYLIWYPLLSSRAAKKSGKSEKMVLDISQLSVKNALNITFQVEENTEDAGMYGSGLLILNAPWKLDEQLQSALPEISKLLTGTSDNYSLQWLVKGT
ncbi:23S rRNA (adenine(2030)-N(6))-methyltransferase RlmJ [Aliiglaciecola sp. M165]|uniref:23S rRNA (adenine(2030)-N(6))-methyltransferase RlmJ n=1 Tax=Aliiglaciecola sp. M165 TaxID=2593649 RepID=UPI001180B8D1|nr:23S rRNA (adenine(2030)-N(6))-methyltransferase RlmJ [Aliiglaciecola sp. M165]TRY30061.1 23S rRNA (adenine(2030)-N(6))-methyltransferase RlmJ [Aliiglaciecola sp. M165]